MLRRAASHIPLWFISVRWVSCCLTCKINRQKKIIKLHIFNYTLWSRSTPHSVHSIKANEKKKSGAETNIHFIFNDRVQQIKTRNDCFLMKPKLHMMSDVMTNVNLKIYLVFSSTVWWFFCSGFVYFHTVTECVFFSSLAVLILEW